MNMQEKNQEVNDMYQANIAMFVFDAIRRAKGKKYYMTNKALHEACNQGAKDFLDMLEKVANGGSFTSSEEQGPDLPQLPGLPS